jgi:MFS family permease
VGVTVPRILPVVCAISFFCFLGSYMRIPIVPLFAASLGADAVRIGFINAAFTLAAGALSIPAGLASDRLGRRIPLVFGMLLLSGSSFLLYLCATPLQMAGVYLLFGVGLSAFSPTLMSYVADFTPPAMIGRAYGWYTLALYGGMTLGPAAGGFLGTALGLRPVFLVSGGVILAMLAVAVACLPEVPASRNGNRPPVLPALRELSRNRRFVACMAATAGGCAGFGMFVTFMPIYIRELGLGTGAVGAVFATQSLANALSRIPAGRVSDRSGRRRLVVTAGFALFAASMAAFAWCRSAWALAAGAAAMGVGMGSAFTLIAVLIVDAAPKGTRGLAMGCYNTSIYAGMMASSIGMGALIRAYGFGTAFPAAGAVVAAASALFACLWRPGGAPPRAGT